MFRHRNRIFVGLLASTLLWATVSCLKPENKAVQPPTPARPAPARPMTPQEKIALAVSRLNVEQVLTGRTGRSASSAPLYPGEFDHQICAPADELVSAGSAALGPVKEATKSKDPIISRNAAMVLARLGDPAAVPLLYAVAEDENLRPAIRTRAIALLAELSAKGKGAPLDFARLKALYDQPAKTVDVDRAMQVAVVRAAGSAAGDEAYDFVFENLGSPDLALQYAAIETLPLLKPKETPPALVAAVDSANPRLAIAAMQTLATVDAAQLAPKFAKLLAHADPDLRVVAIRLVSETVPPNAGRLVAAALADSDLAVEREAVRTAEKLGEVSPLESALDNPRLQIREAAVQALGRMKSTRSLPVLALRAKDTSPNVRQALAAAVTEIGHPLGGTVLVELLSDPSPVVRAAARDGFAKLSGEKMGDYNPALPPWNNEPPILRAKKWAEEQQAKTPPIETTPKEGEETAEPPTPLDRDIQKLIDGLALPPGQPRQLAIATLVRLKDQAKPALEAAADSRPPAISNAILDEVLPIIEPLYMDIRNLRDDDATKRRQAVIHFAVAAKDRKLPQAAYRKVHEALATETDGMVRSLLTDRLIDSGDKDLTATLIAGLKLPDPRTRQSAARSLGRLKSREAVPELIKALGDERNGVQYAAAWALGEIGDTSAIAPLEKALITREIPGRLAFGAALARLGAASGRDELIRLLSGTTTQTQVDVAAAMAEAPNASFIAPLIERLDPANLQLTAAANSALIKMSGQDFGYRPQSSAVDRARALAAWRTWFAETQQVKTPGK
jgi:HEAT repeat protein